MFPTSLSRESIRLAHPLYYKSPLAVMQIKRRTSHAQALRDLTNEWQNALMMPDGVTLHTVKDSCASLYHALFELSPIILLMWQGGCLCCGPTLPQKEDGQLVAHSRRAEHVTAPVNQGCHHFEELKHQTRIHTPKGHACTQAVCYL